MFKQVACHIVTFNFKGNEKSGNYWNRCVKGNRAPAALDFAVLLKGEKLLHMQVSNDKKGINTFYKKVCQHVDLVLGSWLFCLEHTGIYCNPILEFAAKKRLPIWMEADAARTRKKSKLFMALKEKKTIN